MARTFGGGGLVGPRGLRRRALSEEGEVDRVEAVACLAKLAGHEYFPVLPEDLLKGVRGHCGKGFLGALPGAGAFKGQRAGRMKTKIVPVTADYGKMAQIVPVTVTADCGEAGDALRESEDLKREPLNYMEWDK